MLYRYADGTYKLSSFDGEWSKVLTKDEGDAVLRKRVGHREFSEILKSNFKGFMPSNVVEAR